MPLAAMKFGHGYDATYHLNLDGLGILYLSIAASWTAVLLVGIAFLYANRRLPFIRIRNVALTVSAVLTLHVYWVLCFVAYVLQAKFPCSTEFWIMSIYLPLGIALFNVCNSQLLHVAGLQRKILSKEDTPLIKSTTSRESSGWRRLRILLDEKHKMRQMLTYMAYGMIVQFIVTVFIYLAARKFHPGFGLYGEKYSSIPGTVGKDPICIKYQLAHGFNDCDAAYRLQCRRGWEWVPSIAWQFFWAWVYAPYLLWKVRGIRDHHGWRTQTVCCSIAGMISSPMWLVALYVPTMSTVDTYFIPPMWFTGPIFLIEGFLVYVPCWQILKNRRLRLETLDIIAEWECKNNGTSLDGTTQAGSRISLQPSSVKTTGTKRSEMYTMAALDSCIRTNSHPLLLFAALKDFSGENIAFLTKVLQWKRGWTPSTPFRGNGFLRRPNEHEISNKHLQRQQFRLATDIYASFISLKYSEFPVNISSAQLKELEVVFENAAFALYGKLASKTSEATPFDVNQHTPLHGMPDIESGTGDNVITNTSTHKPTKDLYTNSTVVEVPLHGQETLLQSYELNGTAKTLPEYVPTPTTFGPDVFDDAEESIKYMVLTNTWPKFVNAGYARQEKQTWLSHIQRRLRRRNS